MHNTPDVSPFWSLRGGSNAWALRPDVISAWVRRKQAEVPPMTMEWAPILSCDADCPMCPYRKSRLLLGDGTVAADSHAAADDLHAASLATATRVLDVAWQGGVRGVLFTGGGEPLVWGHLPAALRYSASLGMDNCLYTNGFRLGFETDLAQSLLDPAAGLVFVRVSVNAVTAQVVRKHWGLSTIQVDHQIAGLTALLRARRHWEGDYARLGRPLPSIQISTVVDRLNAGDLVAICRTVADTFQAHRGTPGIEDVMAVRPLTIHGRRSGYSTMDHDEMVITSILRQCGSSGEGRQRLNDAGVPLYLGFGLDKVESGDAESYSAVIEREYAERDVSWATGLFLTVGPDGTVYPSTEHNCEREWAIGSLLNQSVSEIYASPQRRAMLDRMNEERWGPSVAQPTSRTARLDRIAKAILSGALRPADIHQIARQATHSHRAILD